MPADIVSVDWPLLAGYPRLTGKPHRDRSSRRTADGPAPTEFVEGSSDGTHLRALLRVLVVSEFSMADSPASNERSALSVLWVVCAAIMCGVGLFFVTGAVIRFAGGIVDWTWWAGLIPLVLGFFMLMSPRAGPQGPH